MAYGAVRGANPGGERLKSVTSNSDVNRATLLDLGLTLPDRVALQVADRVG